MPQLRIKPIPLAVDSAREEIFARLSGELRPDFISRLNRDDIVKVVESAVQIHLERKGIQVEPTARRNLIDNLTKDLLAANPVRGKERGPRREYPVRRPLKRPPIHPGTLMREVLEDHFQMTISDAARRMKVSRPALYAVLNGTSAVTAEMALRFACLTGGAPELYLNMQTGHDLEEAAERLQGELRDIFPQTDVISGGLDQPAPSPSGDRTRHTAINRSDRGSRRAKA